LSWPWLSLALRGLPLRRALWALAGLGLLFTGPAGAAKATGTGDVEAHLGPITVSATALRPGPAGTLTASVRVTSSGQFSDQLDAAITGGGAPVGLYHKRVSVGEIPDLTGCGGDAAPPGVVDQWLHYGPLLIPGGSAAPAPPAVASLTVLPVRQITSEVLVITLYFAHAGPMSLYLPVDRA